MAYARRLEWIIGVAMQEVVAFRRCLSSVGVSRMARLPERTNCALARNLPADWSDLLHKNADGRSFASSTDPTKDQTLNQLILLMNDPVQLAQIKNLGDHSEKELQTTPNLRNADGATRSRSSVSQLLFAAEFWRFCDLSDRRQSSV
jgi:hypothetical protein